MAQTQRVPIHSRDRITHDKTLSAANQTDFQTWLENYTGIIAVNDMQASEFTVDCEVNDPYRPDLPLNFNGEKFWEDMNVQLDTYP